jgi:hypothetical protein
LSKVGIPATCGNISVADPQQGVYFPNWKLRFNSELRIRSTTWALLSSRSMFTRQAAGRKCSARNSYLLEAGGVEWRMIIDHVSSDFLRNGRAHFAQHKRQLRAATEASCPSMERKRLSSA